MQNQFYVSSQGEQSGPFPIQEIVAKLNNGALQKTDYIFDETVNDWILIIEFELIIQLLKSNKPKTVPKNLQSQQYPPQSQQSSQSVHAMNDIQTTIPETAKSKKLNDLEWYILKGENRYGPFSYLDVLKMLQEKAVFEFDFVWNSNMTNWARIAEVAEFKPEYIRQIKDNIKDSDAQDVFFRRKHVRVPFMSDIIIHDNKQVWAGKSAAIGIGGAGIIVGTSLLMPGKVIYVHFKPNGEIPPFNAICEVVNKEHVKEGIYNQNANVQYGVKFTKISNETQTVIQTYIEKVHSANSNM